MHDTIKIHPKAQTNTLSHTTFDQKDTPITRPFRAGFFMTSGTTGRIPTEACRAFKIARLRRRRILRFKRSEFAFFQSISAIIPITYFV